MSSRLLLAVLAGLTVLAACAGSPPLGSSWTRYCNETCKGSDLEFSGLVAVPASSGKACICRVPVETDAGVGIR
jgi:hypothetical protein